LPVCFGDMLPAVCEYAIGKLCFSRSSTSVGFCFQLRGQIFYSCFAQNDVESSCMCICKLCHGVDAGNCSQSICYG
jgi:hypothetical protein